MSMTAGVLRCVRSCHDIRLLDGRTCEDLTLHIHRPARVQLPSLEWYFWHHDQSATLDVSPRCQPRPPKPKPRRPGSARMALAMMAALTVPPRPGRR